MTNLTTKKNNLREKDEKVYTKNLTTTAEVTALPAAQPTKKTIDQSTSLDIVMETMFESIDRSATNTIEQQIINFFTKQIPEGPSHITMIKINLIGQMIRMGASLEEIQPVIYQNLVFQDIRKGSSPFFAKNEEEIRRVSEILAPPNQGQYQVKVQPMIINDDDYTRVFELLIAIISNTNIDIPNREKFIKSIPNENSPISIDDYLVTIDHIIANKMIPDSPDFLLYNVDKYNEYINFHYINKQNPIYNLVDNSFRDKNSKIGFTDIEPILRRVMMFKSYFKFLSSGIIDIPNYLYNYLHCLMILRIYIISLTSIEITGEPIAALKNPGLGGKSRNKRGNKKTNRRKTIRRRKNKSIRHKSIRHKTIRRKER